MFKLVLFNDFESMLLQMLGFYCVLVSLRKKSQVKKHLIRDFKVSILIFFLVGIALKMSMLVANSAGK